MSNYYSFFGDDNRTALIMANINGDTSTIAKSALWYILKDDVSPRLHGDYGKLLKKLKQYEQDTLTTNSTSTISSPKFSKITSNSDFDCGTFYDVNNKRYSMAVSRWYNSNNSKIKIEHERLSYKNYTIHEYYNSTDSSKYVIDGKLTLYSTLDSGQACLYEIKPALFYGGKLLLDESVTINIELTGCLEITANKVLKIGDSCTYTISGELYARNGSSICSDHKGDIVFSGNGKYRHETWENSLFYIEKNGHPKLVWGSLQGNQTYGVYRKSGTTYLLIATIYSTDNNIKQTYIDSSITIYNGQLAGSEVYYKISRISGGRTYYTNEVSVTISSQSMEKQNIFIKEFAIEQNYPNPFNGMTSIKYMIPESGIVRIKIFDILGKEIKVFNEGEKEVGFYEFKFNSGELSSGIYIYSVQYNNKILSKKMLLMK
jgi:hypothetical protein